MSALSARASRSIQFVGPALGYTYKVADAAVIYKHAFVGLAGSGYATSATAGYAIPFEDATAVQYLGLAEKGGPNQTSINDSVTGDTDASPVPTIWVVTSPFIVLSATVTGASAVSDNGKLVYLSNDNDMTLSSGTVVASGVVEEWVSSTTCHVKFFGRDLWRVYAAAA